MTEVKPVALSDRIRREGDLSSRAGQLDRLYGLADEVDALRAEVEGLRADAERYRFIRSIGGCPFAETDSAWLSPTSLDAEIDIWMRIKADARAKEAQDGR